MEERRDFDHQELLAEKATLDDLTAAEAAARLMELPRPRRALVFRLMEKDRAVEVFENLDPDEQQDLLEGLHDHEVLHILEAMSADDRARLFDEMPAGVTARLLETLTPGRREATALLLGYAPDTAGRIMIPEYISLRADLTVREALEKIRRVGLQRETINTLYVTDAGRRLIGVISLQELVLADPEARVETVAEPDVVSVHTDTDQEEVARLVELHDVLAIPVVDAEDRLVGIVTWDDALDVLDDEATEDFHRISGVAPVEIDYPRATIPLLWRKRIGWLLVLLLADFLSSSVIAFFEEAIEAVVALAFFIPMLIDSGGNTGTQSAALIIRGLATGQVRLTDWLRVLGKELGVGALLGGTLGLIVYLRGFFWRGGPEVGLVVGLTMVVLVLWANILGALLPLLLTRLRLDPAVVSSPFITTAADVTGLVVYFSIAKWVLAL